MQEDRAATTTMNGEKTEEISMPGNGIDPAIPDNASSRTDNAPSREADIEIVFFKKEFRIFLVVGIALIIAGLGVHAAIQSSMESKLTLDSDFDEEFITHGQSTYVNTDYLFHYNPMYNGTGESAAHGPFESEKVTQIKGVKSHGSYVEYSYITNVTEQPTFLIDVNTGAAPGGIALLPPEGPPHGVRNGPGGPGNGNDSQATPFPMQPHRSSTTTLYLDKDDWDYRTDIYEKNDLTAKRGHVRSLITHDLEKKSYNVWIGPIENTTVATYLRSEDVRDIESYVYSYNYTMQLPFPVYTYQYDNLSAGPTVFLEWQETTEEYHEPITGALVKLSTNLTYRLNIVGQGPPQSVTIYSEESEYEISGDDAKDFSKGLFFMKHSGLVMVILGIAGVVVLAIGIIRTGKDME